MPQVTLAEALIGVAALGAVTTAVSNNVAQKGNIAQQDKAIANARQAWLAAQNNNQKWLNANPKPGTSGQNTPLPSGMMGNGPATGTGGPSPSIVANNVMRGLSGAGAMGSPAAPPSASPAALGGGAPSGIPPTSMPQTPNFNVQAILAKLAGQPGGLALA